eukprot:403337558
MSYQQRQNQHGSQSVIASSGYQLNPVGLLTSGQQFAQQHHMPQNMSNQQPTTTTILVNPPPSQRSIAEQYLKPIPTLNMEENRKLYVGKIPKNVTDDFMERLFRCCGQLISWKRSTDASGEPKAFGFVEFENIESVFACLKIINNLPLMDSRIIVKANEKTNQFLNDWRELKKMDWLSKMEKTGQQVDNEDLEYKEQLGELMPYEQELIPNYDEVINEIQNTIEKKEIIEQVAAQQKQSEQPVKQSQYESDPFQKYKEHEREQRRERRIKNIEREREGKFQKKVEEWLQREANRDREKEREAEREKDRLRDKMKLIEQDLNYDSGEEKKKRKKNPREYERYLEERKRIREKEREDDEADRKKEAEEMIELEKKRAEERRKQEEQKRREDEIRERLKLKRFMELEEMERQKQHEEEQQQQLQQQQQLESSGKRQKINEGQVGNTDYAAGMGQGRAGLMTNSFAQPQAPGQQQQQQSEPYSYQQQQMDNYRIQRFGAADQDEQKSEYDQYQMKKHKPFAKLSENTVQNIKNIESEMRGKDHSRDDRRERDKKYDGKQKLKEYMEDEEKRKILEKTKELYAKLPKSKEDIFKSPLNWNSLLRYDVIEKVGRPWIGKKVKEYMGVEDQSIVSLIIKILNQKLDHQQLQAKMKDIFDKKTEEFVMKLWQTFTFENMKIDEGLYESTNQ